MIGVALRGLAMRKLRTLLTALAIVLGVAMVSGTYFLTDRMREATESLTGSAYEDVDAVIAGREAFDVDPGETSSRSPLVEEEALPPVRRLPEVGAAVPEITGGARLIGRDGDPIGSQAAPSFGVGFDADEPGSAGLTPFELDAGRYPSGRGEVAIDAATADREGIGVGDAVGVAARGPVEQFEVVGIARFGSARSIGSATISLFTLETAQSLLEEQGLVDSILVAGAEGVSSADLREALAGALPPRGRLTTAAEQDRFELGGVEELVDVIQTFLLVFGGIALFVGAFIIFNTLSITVAQRARELGMLRTIGASRRQVLGSIVVEALAIGLLASFLGLAVGFGLAEGLSAVVAASGVELPRSGTALAPRTVLVSLAVGTLVTVLAGLVPAVRATRVAPVEALREQPPPPSGARLRPLRAVFGGLALAGGLAALAVAAAAAGLETGGRLALVALGAILLFAGLTAVSPVLVRPLASALGRPAERLAGASGALARRNSMRNPGRTAAVAAALTIGLGLVTAVAVLQKGVGESSAAAVDEQLAADYVVTSHDGASPFAPEAAEALEDAPAVAVTSSVGKDQAQVSGKLETVAGVEPATFGDLYELDWTDGSDAALDALGPDGAIVTTDLAEARGLGVGSPLEAVSGLGESLDLTVRGIHDPPELSPLALGDVIVSDTAFGSAFRAKRPSYVLAGLEGPVTPGATAVLEESLADFPDVSVQTLDEYKEAQEAGLDELAGILYVLLGLSVVVALLGIVNTLVLAVFERTRELGLLRAVGMTRRQARRMVRHESVITALLGTVLGVGAGMLLAALAASALSEVGVAFAVPVVTLAVLAVIAVVAGVAAAVLPARRAARVDVLDALQYE